MNLDLNGKRALIGGASEGIGRATAIELATLGATVTVMARRESALQAVVGELPGNGHDFIVIDFDDHEALETLASETLAKRNYSILVNNAGGPAGGPLLAAKPEEFLVAFHRHLLTNQRLAQAVLPAMQAAKYGRIINVISTSVYEPIPGLGVSNTIRAAVAAWAKTLAGEVAADGVTVNNVLPGFTETGRLEKLFAAKAGKSGKSVEAIAEEARAQIPMRRFALPEETAAAIAFLASPAAGYITGHSLPVDGGRLHGI